jgi:hypothetical protein
MITSFITQGSINESKNPKLYLHKAFYTDQHIALPTKRQ